MSSRDRALSIIEVLARDAMGLPLSEISDRLGIPRSATHRLLSDLREMGYVRQEHDGGTYRLTVKLAALALAYCSGVGMTDLVRPILDQLAERTGELVMLSVLEGEQLMRVAKAQGARRGLMYNPDEAGEVSLATTANGHAFLSCLSEEQVLEFVARQGFKQSGLGPKAPKTLRDVLGYVEQARIAGHAIIHDMFEAGTSAIAVAIMRAGATVPIGTLSIAGPSQRMNDAQLTAFAPMLKTAAAQIALAARESTLFADQPDT